MDVAEVLVAISKSSSYGALPAERAKRLEATWAQFVTARMTLEQPDWGTLVSILMVALPDEEADIFAETLETFS